MRRTSLILAATTLGGAMLLGFGVGAIPGANPSVLGRWKPEGYHAGAHGGQSSIGSQTSLSGFSPDQATPAEPVSFTIEPDQASWTLSFTAQKGGAFSGTATSPRGEASPVVGAFRSDGRRFAYSTPFGSGTGDVDGNQLEWCFTSVVPGEGLAECTVYQRTAK